MYEKRASYNLPLGESKYTLDQNMFKLLEFGIWILMKTNHAKGGGDLEFVNFYIKTLGSKGVLVDWIMC